MASDLSLDSVLQTVVDGARSLIATRYGALRALARHLGVAENTVKFHVRNILDKLHVHDRAQAVAHALRKGLVRFDPGA